MDTGILNCVIMTQTIVDVIQQTIYGSNLTALTHCATVFGSKFIDHIPPSLSQKSNSFCRTQYIKSRK